MIRECKIGLHTGDTTQWMPAQREVKYKIFISTSFFLQTLRMLIRNFFSRIYTRRRFKCSRPRLTCMWTVYLGSFYRITWNDTNRVIYTLISITCYPTLQNYNLGMLCLQLAGDSSWWESLQKLLVWTNIPEQWSPCIYAK